MDLSREICEREIKSCQTVIETMEDGLLVNTLVQKYFEERLKEFPKKKDGKSNIPQGVG